MDLLTVTQEQLEGASKTFIDVEKDVYSLSCKDDAITKGFIKFCPYFNADGSIGPVEQVICDITLVSRDKTNNVHFNLAQDTKEGYNLTHLLFGIKEKMKNMGDDNCLKIKIKRYSVAQILSDSVHPDFTNKIVLFRFNQTLKKVMNEGTNKKTTKLYEVSTPALELLLKPISKNIEGKTVSVPSYELCSVTDKDYSIVAADGTSYANATSEQREAISAEIMKQSEYLRSILKEFSIEKNIDNIYKLELMLREYGITTKLSVDRKEPAATQPAPTVEQPAQEIDMKQDAPNTQAQTATETYPFDEPSNDAQPQDDEGSNDESRDPLGGTMSSGDPLGGSSNNAFGEAEDIF
jgi:hypothetical protein